MGEKDKKAEAVVGTGTTHGDNGAKRPLRDGIDGVRGAIDEKVAHAREGLDHALTEGRDRAADAYATGRDRASEAYQSAFDRAKAAAAGIDGNPIASLAGAVAIGVAIGALLPRTEREGKLYGAVGDRLGQLAVEAAGAAKDAGRTKLADLGVSQDKGRDLVRLIVDAVVQSIAAAGSAAVDTAKSRGTTH